MKTLIVIMVCLTSLVFAQGSTIVCNEPSSITEMMSHRKTLNFNKNRKVKAWSLQLFTSRDKYKATERFSIIKRELAHLDTDIDWYYENPYYRIYMGSFYTKLEAASLLHKVIEFYPNAYIFKNAESTSSKIH